MTDAQNTADQATLTAREIAKNAKRLGLTWDLRPATVTDGGSGLVTVTFDGDPMPSVVVSLIGALVTGQRVMIMFVPPSGNYVIGRIDDGGWQELTLLAGWTNRGAGFPHLACRLVPAGIQISGQIQSGTTADNTVVAQLPAGFRPITEQVILIWGGTGLARWAIETTGNMLLFGVGAGTSQINSIIPQDW